MRPLCNHSRMLSSASWVLPSRLTAGLTRPPSRAGPAALPHLLPAAQLPLSWRRPLPHCIIAPTGRPQPHDNNGRARSASLRPARLLACPSPALTSPHGTGQATAPAATNGLWPRSLRSPPPWHPSRCQPARGGGGAPLLLACLHACAIPPPHGRPAALPRTCRGAQRAPTPAPSGRPLAGSLKVDTRASLSLQWQRSVRRAAGVSLVVVGALQGAGRPGRRWACAGAQS
jgi:hypothetical protein